jgi:hypothetical protein
MQPIIKNVDQLKLFVMDGCKSKTNNGICSMAFSSEYKSVTLVLFQEQTASKNGEVI